MIQVRKSGERGFFDHGWLKTYHTFSFADYRDTAWTTFRSLRVINEDWVAAGEGFPTHSHRDMEIVTYILKGALEHKDSMGNTSVIRPGDIQRMSAGTGVTHSEFNHMSLEPVHLLQIWIMPQKRSTPPSYEEKKFEASGKRNRLRLIVAPAGEKTAVKTADTGTGDGAVVRIHQDARIYDARLDAGQKVKHTVAAGRGAWIQMISGSLDANGTKATAGDGLFTETPGEIALTAGAGETAEFLLFDLA